MSHKTPPYSAFLKKSQKTIADLKRKLAGLKKTEHELEKEEEHLLKKISKPTEVTKVSLSVESVFKAAFAILAVVALVYLVIFTKKVIILFLVALFLSAAFAPGVDRLQKYHIPRPLGILILYAVVLGVLTVMFTSLVPIIAEQIGALAVQLRTMVQNVVSGQGSDSWLMQKLEPLAAQVWQNIDQTQLVSTVTNSLREVATRLTNFAGNALGAIFAVFNGIMNLVLVLIITFFMIMNKQNTSDFFRSLFPRRYSDYITVKTKQISHRIGEWIRGVVVLAFAMALVTFIILSVINVNYALTLAMVAGIGEFLPYIGPLITFASAALIALNQDPILFLWLIPAYALIQFIESNILVPLIIGKSVGLNPVVIMFSLFCGASIGAQLGGSAAMGFVGMILAVPVANIISIFVEDYTEKNK